MISYATNVFSRLIANAHTDPLPRRTGADPAMNRPKAEPNTGGEALQGTVVETDVPARLDSLPFGRFHLLVIIALGITWILDGLGVTLTRDLSGELKSSSPRGSAAGPTC